MVAYACVGGLVVNVGALVVMLVALADGFVVVFGCLFWLIVFRFLLLLPIGCNDLRG